MDENNNNNGDLFEKQHTEQNIKKALQVAEKGAATSFAGPGGAAAVNALHNAPIVGNTLNKVEDKAIEKLGKNRNVANFANRLGDSGATDVANKGLDAASAGGATSGATGLVGDKSATTSEAKGINEGLGKLPGGSGDGGNNDIPPSEKLGKDAKKTMKVLKIIAPAIPIIGGVFFTLIIVVIVMSQIMVIKDKILGVIVEIGETGQKLQNFVTGQGWNTEDEEFFKRLKLAYADFKKESNENLDIPLIAATIHYSKVTDMNNWDGTENEHSDDVGLGEDNYSDSQDSGLGSAVIESFQTWSFYNVANAKLGNWNTIIPGGRGLLGHMVSTEFSIDEVCIDDALGEWQNFITDMFNIPDWGVYEEAYGVTGDQVGSFVSSLIYGQEGSITSLTNPLNIVETINNIIAFNDQGQSYPEWWQANIVYEIKELGQYLTGNYNDEKLKGISFSYYNNFSDSTAPQNIGEQIKNYWNEFFSTENFTIYDSVKKCFTVSVPSINRKLDYKAYYRYLVNIYIPVTYYRGLKLGEDYTFLEVVNMANDIFDQKYLYDYLIGEEDETLDTGCSFNFSGSSSATVSIDKNMIDNLYVNVMSPNCPSATNCSTIEETVSLKDYVIGVVYREIGASISDNEDYLKANIITAKSFTVGRRTILQNGDTYSINMINSTDDQVYCSVTNGCLSASSNAKAAPSEELLEYLGKLYDEVNDSFLYNSTIGNFTGYYRAKESQCIGANYAGSCLGQIESKLMGESGTDFEGILGHFFAEPIGIVDISTGSLSMRVNQCISSGLQLGTDGYYIRTTVPEITNIFFNAPYVSDSNRGQCVWYVKGRAQEIIANSIADASKKLTAKNAITGMAGNGNQWYSSELTTVFGSSQDSTLPKAGAIAVYDWNESRCISYWQERGYNTCVEKYGHSLIVESVVGDAVTISEGYTSCSTGSPSWSCVRFNSTTYSISEMDDLGGRGYKFIGYIYLLN